MPDWRPRLAIVWTPPQQTAHWHLELDDGQSFNGISHTLTGERMLSWFTFEVPREVPPGPHALTARLIDDATGASLAQTSQSVSVNSSARCSA